MVLKNLLSFILSLWYINQFGHVNAVECPTAEQSLVQACVFVLDKYNFTADTDSSSSDLRLYYAIHAIDYFVKCSNSSWLASMDNCILQNYLGDSETYEYSVDYLSQICPQYPSEVSNATLSEIVFANPDDVSFYLNLFEGIRHEVLVAQNFSWGLIGFWAVVIAICTVYNFNKKLIGINTFINNKLTKFIQKFIIMPPLFHKSEKSLAFAKFLTIDIPKRLDSIVFFLFLVQIILSSSLHYPESPDTPYFAHHFLLLELISHRICVLALALIPVIFFFGVRNNPFALITGISQSTFISYHKALAVLMLIMSTTHALIWTVYAVQFTTYEEFLYDSYWKWGVVACTIAGVMIFLALKFFRNIMYELFLVLHQLFIALFTVSMYYHITMFGYQSWIYAIIAIVVFDRVMRIFRILTFGGFFQDALITRHGHSTDGNSDVLKIQINKPWLMPYFPGLYVFVSFALPWYKIWQSHPFTIISYSDSQSDSKFLVMYLKARKGITRSVFNIPDSKWDENDSIKTKVIIDGPYGVSTFSKNDNFRTLIGVCAGMGFTAVLPGFLNAINNKKANTFAESKSMGSFTWIINDLSHLTWANEHLNYLEQNNVSVKVYYTGNNGSQEKSESCFPPSQFTEATPSDSIANSSLTIKTKLESKSNTSISEIKETTQVLNLPVKNLYTINISGKRPDLVDLVSEEILAQRNKKIKIISCGPNSFNDNMSDAVLRNIDLNDAEQDIEFSSESFVW